MARLDSLDIEDVVDESNETLRVLKSDLQEITGLRRNRSGRSCEHESECAANRRERRAKLVAYGRDEFRLQTLDLLELPDVVTEPELTLGDGCGERAERFTELPELATSASNRAYCRAMISRGESAGVEHDRVEGAGHASKTGHGRQHDHRHEEKANEQRFPGVELDLTGRFSRATFRLRVRDPLEHRRRRSSAVHQDDDAMGQRDRRVFRHVH